MSPLRSFFSSTARQPASPPGEELPRGAALLALRNVEKYYETAAGRSYVLRRITLDIAHGEFVTIMGPSGAGKSTLLSILGMLDGAWSGEYDFVGHPVHAMANKERV